MVEGERIDVDAGLGDERRCRPERLGERRCLGVRVHEEERPPGVDGEWDEAQLPGVEPVLALGARRAHERGRRGRRSTRGRGTGSWRARSAPSTSTRAPVAADVEEGAQRAVARRA